MTISSNYLDAFLAVSQTLNFTKAAEKLHITQSALSQRIINLENELETSLFIRDRAGLRLTEAALKLVRYCQIKSNLEAEFLNQLKSNNPHEVAGSIRIGGFSSVMSSVTLTALAPLIKKNPQVQLQIFNEEMYALFELLKRGEIDYMILDDRIERAEFERLHLGNEKNVLVEHKNYIGSDIFLDHDAQDMTTINYLKKSKQPYKDLQRLYLDNVFGIIEGVRLKLGRAVLPLHLVKNEKDFLIINTLQQLEIPVYLYYFNQPYYSRLHTETVEALKIGFSKILT